MIIGIGSDLCNIERIQAALTRFGARFERRCFTDEEIIRAQTRIRPHETYAKRFAAKEACAKALGTGVLRRGIYWRDMGVINLPSGQPTLRLTAGAQARLETLTPRNHVTKIHLTMTDDRPWAGAHVVIETLPTG